MWFENEEIKFEEEKEENAVICDDEINNKYIIGDVRIITEQARYPLDTIKIMIESGKYELNPVFQRRHRWGHVKKSRLIESFIMNVPIPPIFLYEDQFSYYEVMDGLQRLTAIYEFYTNKFELEGLEYWTELNGRKYSTLPEKIKQGIDRRYISSIILLQETAKDKNKAQEMKQLVFERINNGGIKLEGQETRNALYNGPMNQICLDLSTNTNLQKLIGIQTRDAFENQNEYQEALDKNEIYKKMDDVEYVLRFFAMRQINGYQKRNLSQFLDAYLKAANLYPEILLKQLKGLFKETIEFAYELFGEKAFYLWRCRNGKWNWLNRCTTTVYDPLMQVLSNLLPKKDKILKKKNEINDNITTFYQKFYDDFEGRNNNKSNIEKRMSLLQKFLLEIIGE